MDSGKIRVTIWNEFIHEKTEAAVTKIYPRGIHEAIADGLRKEGQFELSTATLDQPEHGLTAGVLEKTDVLVWWAHMAHDKVDDAIAARVQQRVVDGMGLIVLHSGHLSKPFLRLIGTTGSLRWREAGEKEIIWTVDPGHEIARGIPPSVILDHEEMYGEPFCIPAPEKTVFISWFEGGDVFRSGCCWERGNGRIFYFRPGHESYPTYYKKEIIAVISNACRWAAQRLVSDMRNCSNVQEPISPILGNKA